MRTESKESGSLIELTTKLDRIELDERVVPRRWVCHVLPEAPRAGLKRLRGGRG